MSISAISKSLFSAATPAAASTSTAAPPPPPNVNTSANATISTTDFMKLLSTEMAQQDPMKPMDPTETMTQLAQFSTLQQTNVLSQNQSLATANSYIGATVTIPGQNGAAATSGVVTGVDTSAVAGGGVPKLVIAGVSAEYPVNSISMVSVPAATTGSGTTTTSSTPATSTSSTK